MAQLNEPVTGESKRMRTWKTYLRIVMTIALPVFDSVTDIYTLLLYYDPNKPLMQKAFFASLVTICLHNVISGANGLLQISKVHAHTKLVLWESLRGKLITTLLHAAGLGNLFVPLEAIICKKYTDR